MIDNIEHKRLRAVVSSRVQNMLDSRDLDEKTQKDIESLLDLFKRIHDHLSRPACMLNNESLHNYTRECFADQMDQIRGSEGKLCLELPKGTGRDQEGLRYIPLDELDYDEFARWVKDKHDDGDGLKGRIRYLSELEMEHIDQMEGPMEVGFQL